LGVYKGKLGQERSQYTRTEFWKKGSNNTWSEKRA